MKLLWLLTVFLLACVHLAEAQRPNKVPHVAFFRATTADSAGPFISESELNKTTILLGARETTPGVADNQPVAEPLGQIARLSLSARSIFAYLSATL